EGMADVNKLRAAAEGITGVEEGEDTLTLHTLYDGDVTVARSACLAERCENCKSRCHVAYDELLGDTGDILDSHRFDEVEALERMTPEERFAFWQSQLSRCIRCNACRDVCPACTCEKCVFDNPQSGVQNKAAADPFEEKLFHIIRAYHVAGRCTDCGECSRVCPQHIPLHLLNRKFIRDIDRFYGDYQAGKTVGSRGPLVDYTLDDIEPGDAVKGGGTHA
ncbi:MAG: 4Fe-4S dicluster domain-containing protein, partial [Clostridia bacterium]|nr:4Fe-4S dicluster domain-containing protein [Clostridia bacterium]